MTETVDMITTTTKDFYEDTRELQEKFWKHDCSSVEYLKYETEILKEEYLTKEEVYMETDIVLDKNTDDIDILAGELDDMSELPSYDNVSLEKVSEEYLKECILEWINTDKSFL